MTLPSELISASWKTTWCPCGALIILANQFRINKINYSHTAHSFLSHSTRNNRNFYSLSVSVLASLPRNVSSSRFYLRTACRLRFLLSTAMIGNLGRCPHSVAVSSKPPTASSETSFRSPSGSVLSSRMTERYCRGQKVSLQQPFVSLSLRAAFLLCNSALLLVRSFFVWHSVARGSPA